MSTRTHRVPAHVIHTAAHPHAILHKTCTGQLAESCVEGVWPWSVTVEVAGAKCKWFLIKDQRNITLLETDELNEDFDVHRLFEIPGTPTIPNNNSPLRCYESFLRN
jgi:hypothetical protein